MRCVYSESGERWDIPLCAGMGSEINEYLSLIVRLTSSALVRRIMNAKRFLNYFSTNYVDRSLLCTKLAATMPDKKIFIHDVLSPSERANYNSLKEAAIKNVFKFVWHSAGRVMVHRSQNERVHVVSSVPDLGVILGPGSCQRAELQPVNSYTPISLSITRDDGAEGSGTK